MEWTLPLKGLYPVLFECSADREVLVSDVLDPQVYGMVRSWNLCFHRDFHDWEMEAVYSILDHIYSRMPRGGGDRRIWQLNRGGSFDV